MAKLGIIAKLTAIMAAITATAATAINMPFFGHKGGNFQPTNLTQPGQRLTGGKVQIAADARFDNRNTHDGIGGGSDSYTMFWGSGSSGEGWPTRARWASFEDMFKKNKNLMFSSCASFGQPNDSAAEIRSIWDAIQKVADETGVDHRVILAVIMQESGGCVRAPTSTNGVRNPGLMQCHNGDGTCNSDINHQVQVPCPAGVVTQMVREGTAGTNSGDGFAQCINLAGSATDADFYRASRIYNSGSIHVSGRLECGIATHCYASDIANRLTGWAYAPHGCPCDIDPASCRC